MSAIAAEVQDAKLTQIVQGMIDRGRAQAGATIGRLMTDYIDDAVVAIGPGANGQGAQITFDEGSVGMTFRGQTRSFHPHAAAQFGDKLGIPGAWLRDQIAGAGWQKAMAADVMATTLANTAKRDRVLVRSVGGVVRGVLTDRYRRLASPVLAEAGATALKDVGAVPCGSMLNDLRWSIDAFLPTPIAVPMGPHGVEYIAAGVRFGNSDFGCGAEFASFLLKRLRCVNGAVAESVLRQIHLGGRLPDDVKLSERTYALDTQTQASALGDVIRSILTTDGIRSRVVQVQQSAAVVIDAVDAIGGLVRAKRIQKGEAEKVLAALAANDVDQVPTGPVTNYKLAQALSWISQGDGVAVDRAADLEAIAGGLMFAGAASN